ncbi:translocation protein TolB [Anaerohalosphaera lusitana]|uniref:Translocation protein TolB n=1 Tax=Anaerohalosphaera lusitana TaxID=1936003 RepID=A0A1U9NQ65_9BACT|nr:PD40 domain-containing protein [Anaerohalosphaera lusitana]AQT69874.1 translocation protein TolB [Anaerohalosphaera lusitana]
MVTKHSIRIIILILAALNAVSANAATSLDRQPAIKPDYASITIPSNIAPMNFAIEEEAASFTVKITSGSDSKGFTVKTSTDTVNIPPAKWTNLLKKATGKNIYFEITAHESDGTTVKFKKITNHVATDPIDDYLAYRFMRPIYNGWAKIQIRQRDLTSFDDSRIIHGKKFGNACMNCHTFPNNEPDQMAMGIRGQYGVGTLLAMDGKVQKLGTKWGYTEWHPNRKIAAYSINKVRQFFHAVGMQVRDVVDLDSGIVYYDVDDQQIRTAPALTKPDRLETYPAWTPDGKWLYFCSAPILWEDRDTVPPKNFDKVQYDLRRVSYDAETDTWGEAETVLTAEETGKSVLIPKISSDGKYLVVCLTDYGCFPVYQPSSDLAIIDLDTGEWRKMPDTVNSEYSESWHSFSSNGRWLTFSSKRIGGLLTRTFFCHIDEQGNLSKAFILPQKDPHFYDSIIQTYSLPQLVKGPVQYSEKELVRAALSDEQIEASLPVTGATPKVKEGDDPWQQVRE